jgi:hypothetical protein
MQENKSKGLKRQEQEREKELLRKSYEILGIEEGADEETVKKTYTVLLKKYRGNQEKIDELDDAYNRIMGYYVVDEEEEKYAKSGAGKFKNFWYHYKVPVLVLIATTFALVVLVINSIQTVPNDVNLHFIGDLYVRDINEVYDDVYEHLTNAKAPNVEQLMLESETVLDAQFVADARMKLMSLIASGNLDVIVCDGKTFTYLASQGMFMPLDVEKDEEGRIHVSDATPRSGNLKLDSTLNQAAGKEEETSQSQTEKSEKRDDDYLVYAKNNLGEEYLFGIRLEESKFFTGTNIMGTDLTLALFHQPSNYKLAFELVDLLLNFDPASVETEDIEDDWD